MKKFIRFLGAIIGLSLIGYLCLLWFSSSTEKRFGEMKDIALDIHSICNKSQECPFPLEGWTQRAENQAHKDLFIYRRGYYAIPDYETNTSFNKVAMGNKYFHMMFIPFMDMVYHASGGKDAELLFWKHTEGGKPVKLN